MSASQSAANIHIAAAICAHGCASSKRRRIGRRRNDATIGRRISAAMKYTGAFASRLIDVAKPGGWPGRAGRIQCGRRATATAKPHVAAATRRTRLLVLGENQRRIRSAEAERVGEHVAHLLR